MRHTTHAVSYAFVCYWTYILWSCHYRTSLLVLDWHWIADTEAADFTKSNQSNFGLIVRTLVFGINITEW